MTDPKLRVQWELMLELSYELAGYRIDSVWKWMHCYALFIFWFPYHCIHTWYNNVVVIIMILTIMDIRIYCICPQLFLWDFHLMWLPFTWRSLAQRRIGARRPAGGFHPFVCAWSLNASNFGRLFEDYLRGYVGVEPSTFTLASKNIHIYTVYIYIYVYSRYIWFVVISGCLEIPLGFHSGYNLFAALISSGRSPLSQEKLVEDDSCKEIDVLLYLVL